MATKQTGCLHLWSGASKWPVTACLDSSSEIFCYLVETVLGWREEWRQNKVKRSVCHKIDPMDNTSKILQSCSHPAFTSVKGKVKIKHGVLWTYKTWDNKAHKATASSGWVSCLPSGGKLLNINTNQHNILITVNYIQLCSFICRSEMHPLLTSYPCSRPFERAFSSSVRQRERRLFLLFCHHSSYPIYVGSWCFISSVM